MHDRLVSRRIDALHQCFLVPSFVDVFALCIPNNTYAYNREKRNCCPLDALIYEHETI